MDKRKIVSIEDRIPKLKHQRRKKANRRLIMLLALFFILIAGVIYFQSPLSKVKEITVSGNESYTYEHIVEKSGLSYESNVWKISKGEVEEKLEKIQEIKQATVNVKFQIRSPLSLKNIAGSPIFQRERISTRFLRMEIFLEKRRLMKFLSTLQS